MKRWTLRITICLILGVVTTVGVAWVLAWRFYVTHSASSWWAVSDRGVMGDSSEANVRFVLAERLRHESHMPNGVLPDNTVVTGNQDCVVDAVRVQSFASEVWAGDSSSVQSGWPMRSLAANMGTLYVWEDDAHVLKDEWGFGSLAITETVWIPAKPILPGFLINTLFYAVIWFGLFFAAGRTRRFIRTRRGRCPRCGYDLRGEFDDGCSECGWGRGEEGTEASRQQGIGEGDDGA